MSEPFYAPNPRPRRPMSRAPGDRLWPFRRISTPRRASCANTASGGIEAQFQKDGELLVGRLFERGWQALPWAEENGSPAKGTVDR